MLALGTNAMYTAVYLKSGKGESGISGAGAVIREPVTEDRR